MIIQGEDRRRQGGGGARDPRLEPSARGVRGAQLRGAPGDARRGGAVRVPQGGLHRRGARQPGPPAGRGRGNALPRRDLRAVVADSRPSCCAPSSSARWFRSASRRRSRSTCASWRRRRGPLRQAVAAKRFRGDLLGPDRRPHSGDSAAAPPRRGDPLAVPQIVEQYGGRPAPPRLDPSLIERLCTHDWPFNVRGAHAAGAQAAGAAPRRHRPRSHRALRSSGRRAGDRRSAAPDPGDGYPRPGGRSWRRCAPRTGT